MAVLLIWSLLFGGAAWIGLRIERRKMERQMQRNMKELRLSRNQHAIIADMERGEW